MACESDGRRNVDHTRVKWFAVSCLAHADGAHGVQPLGEGRGEARGHMLHDQNGDGKFARKKRKNFLQGFGTAGGSSQGDDRRGSMGGCVAGLARRGLGRFSRHSFRTGLPQLCGGTNLGNEILPNVTNVERGGRHVLGDVVESSGGQRVERIVRVFRGYRADHDDGPGELAHDATQGLQSIESRHFDVERDHVGIESGNFGERFRSAAGGGGNLKSGLGSDHVRQGGAHESAVVNYQHADGPTDYGVGTHVR